MTGSNLVVVRSKLQEGLKLEWSKMKGVTGLSLERLCF